MEDLENVLKESLEFYSAQERSITARLALLPKGVIKPKKIKGRTYFYLQYRKGKKLITEYLGTKVPEELQEKLEERKKLESELKKVKKALKMLKKKEENVDLTEPVKELLKTFTQNNLWDYGVEIIGSWCFIIYQKYLPVEKYPLRTQDVDILIPLPYRGPRIDISSILKLLGFEEHINPDGSTYFAGSGLKIEFIAPKKGRPSSRPPYVKKLNITPQTLRFTEVLLMSPALIKISRGIKVLFPSPASFVIHKLLISQRWNSREKRQKDLRQAVFLLKYVLSVDEEKERLKKIWKEIPEGWKKRVKKALKEARSTSPLETSIIKAGEDFLSRL